MKNFQVPALEVPAFAAANRQATTDLALLRRVIEASKVGKIATAPTKASTKRKKQPK